MYQKLVSHNEDLARLVDRGYAVAFDSGFLIIRDLPYLDNEGKLQLGALVTKLEFVDQERVIQGDHTVLFAGGIPYGLEGKPVPNLGGGPTTLALTEVSRDIVVQRSFSNKPRDTGKYADFYEKIESYVTQVSGPAMEKYGVSPYTYRAVQGGPPDSVFKFCDTLTSRAEIIDLAAAFKEDVIAVIGLGGTGAYVLDFMAKTPAKEIRGFDHDQYHVHNAYRSPGRLIEGELGKPKAEVYEARYANFRSGLTVRRKFLDSTSTEELKGVTFAFVCVDKGEARAGIFELLISLGIPFIDVGMGLNRKHGALNGLIRTTYYPGALGSQVRAKGYAPLSDGKDGEYRKNVQISELNALNAAVAVMRFKQLRGFYHTAIPYFNMVHEIGDMKMAGNEALDEN